MRIRWPEEDKDRVLSAMIYTIKRFPFIKEYPVIKWNTALNYLNHLSCITFNVLIEITSIKNTKLTVGQTRALETSDVG